MSLLIEGGWSNNAAIAAILGALAAAVLSIVVPRLIGTKKKEQRRLVALLMDEVFVNQASLARFLDTVMPEWMHRNAGRSPFPLGDFVAPRLNTRMYERIQDKLIFLPMIVKVNRYHDRVEALSGLGTRSQGSERGQRDTIRQAGEVLAYSIGLTDDVLSRYPVLDGNDRSRALISDYRAMRLDYEFLTLIVECSYTDLELLVGFIDELYFNRGAQREALAMYPKFDTRQSTHLARCPFAAAV